MQFKTVSRLSDKDLQSGLQLVIVDGLAAEAMTCFTSGTFLVAIALYLGASNFQVGLLATMPVFSNVFQLFSIWLMQRFRSRRAIAVTASFLARIPLLAIAALPFLVTHGSCLQALIILLSFHYFFGSVAGASWNAWMKDLIPDHILGNYFSHRTRLTQLLNVTVSLALAMALDYIKLHFAGQEITAYACMFLAGGIFGLAGIFALYRTPEPKARPISKNIFELMSRPLRSKNFRRLLMFSSSWSFAVNLALPFLPVYMMRGLHLPLTTIIALSIAGQLAGIVCVKSLGKYADQYSNKTIILCFAPLYALVMIAWSFVAVVHGNTAALVLMTLLQVLGGIATAGVNLALNNIGIKLSPAAESASYLAAKNICTAFFSAAGPLAGGLLADFFTQHTFKLGFEWVSAGKSIYVNLIYLEQWGFFFIIGPVIALCAVRLLKPLKEKGEIHRVIFMRHIGKKWKLQWRKPGMVNSTDASSAQVAYTSVKNRFGRIFLYRVPVQSTVAERA